jgi:hypothetical protein
MNARAGEGANRRGGVHARTGAGGSGIGQMRVENAPKKETDGGPGVLRICFFSSRLLATSATKFTVAAAGALQIEN